MNANKIIYLPERMDPAHTGPAVGPILKIVIPHHSQSEDFGEYKKAGFILRLFAFLFDLIFVRITIELLSVPINFLKKSFELSTVQHISAIYTVSTIISILYFIVPVIIWGATPGKRILNLKIINSNETPKISIFKALSRELFAKTISAIPFFIGFMLAGWTEQKQAIHDMICGTYVIRYRKHK